MATFTNYVYSKAAASRILGKKVLNVKVEGDRVKCQLWDQTFRTTTAARFKQHFAEYRKEQAKKLTPNRNFFTCDWYVNGYNVDVRSDRLDCCCEDWKTQKRIGISRPTCKHCYAVLYKLGYGKLSEYLEARGSVKATNQTSETTSQTSSSVAPKLPTINRYKWTWQTYATDHAGNPIKTATTYSNRYPTEKEIIENRKFNHCKGFRLVAIEQETTKTL